MPEPLTQIEQRVYHYLIDFLAEHTYQPSIREIAKQFRIKSTKTVSDLLHALTAKGYIERDQSRSRGVRIIGMAAVGATQPVPLYARARADAPIFAAEDRAGFITVDRRFLPGAEVSCIRAGDGAMAGRGILEGDLVLVNPSGNPSTNPSGVPADGELLAVRLGDRTVVRDRATAQRDGAAVLGTVVGIFRPLYEATPTIAADPEAPVS